MKQVSTAISLVHTKRSTHKALIHRLIKSCLADPAISPQTPASLMQRFSPPPAAATHLDGLVQQSRVGEVVSVDVVGGGVYVHGSHNLVRHV